MLPTLKHRPWTCQGLATLLLVAAIPLSLGLSASAQQTAETGTAAASDAARKATLSGQVTDLEGMPLADADVRVVIPAADIRKLRMTSEYRDVWGKTDASGNYSIDIPDVKKETRVSIDILHPGHRRLVGTLMSGGDPNDVTLSAEGRAEFNAKLPDTLYFAGQVVDEKGKPIEGVSVNSHFNTNSSGAGIERTHTDSDGRFAVYGYDCKLLSKPLEGHADWGKTTASITFKHDRYIQARLAKLEDLDPSNRDDLRVILDNGFAIGGTVKAMDGTPVADLPISISQEKPFQRKVARTDASGHFRFDGIEGGSAKLRVVDVVEKRKSIQVLDINASKTEMIVSLQPFESTITTTHQVLGMTFANVTDAVDKAYDLQRFQAIGAMVVEPGKRFNNFGIGELRSGDVFWMVGNEKVVDFRAMVTQLIKEAKSPTIPPGAPGNVSAYIEENGDARVRVVYTYNDDRGHASMTQYMKLTPQDIAELEKLLETLQAE